jgi:predicted secreted protein
MNQSRRQFVNRIALVLGILGSGLMQLLAPLKAFGRERSPAFAADNLDAALSEFFPGETIPLIANFKLHPLCQGFIETRIKMGESSDIIAVVRTDDQLYSARKFVEVIAGGCG